MPMNKKAPFLFDLTLMVGFTNDLVRDFTNG
jgi:hypothetical protein